MPTTAGTGPSDVRIDIDTVLDDPEIKAILENRIEPEWQRHYDTNDFDGADHIQRFEAALTALRIAEGRDRRASDVTSGRSSTTYEADEIATLRKRVRRQDPGDEFGHAGTVVRDDGRHISTTGSDS
jgi:hypothetical protein